MDLSRFSEEDWTWVRDRLSRKEGGFDERSFSAWLSMPETEAKLITAYGENWTLDQALTLAAGTPLVLKRDNRRRIKKALDGGNGEEKSLRPDKIPDAEREALSALGLEEFKSRVEAKISEYREAFTERTPNDEAAIRDLANAEVAIDALNEKRLLELASPVTDSGSARISRFTRDITALSAQATALQKLMGIDRLRREHEKEKSSDKDEVMDTIDAIGRWVHEECIEITHCKVILLEVYTDFKEYPFRYEGTCPKCGGKVVYEHVPGADDKKALEPLWVGLEEARYSQFTARDDGKEEE